MAPSRVPVAREEGGEGGARARHGQEPVRSLSIQAQIARFVARDDLAREVEEELDQLLLLGHPRPVFGEDPAREVQELAGDLDARGSPAGKHRRRHGFDPGRSRAGFAEDNGRSGGQVDVAPLVPPSFLRAHEAARFELAERGEGHPLGSLGVAGEESSLDFRGQLERQEMDGQDTADQLEEVDFVGVHRW
jgi:hypothetical protein